MMYFIHFLRWLKKLIFFPREFFLIIISDTKKKYFIKNNLKKKNILCIGIPKSGTTLTEQILNLVGYIPLDKSPFYVWDNRNLNHPHDISLRMIKNFDDQKPNYLKLHTHYSEENLNVLKKKRLTIIFSFRSLKDIMISRYIHILNDKDHRLYNSIKNLNLIEGFKKSMIDKNEKYDDIPIKYYAFWEENWKKNIDNNFEDYLILNFDEFKENKSMYIDKILNFLNISDIESELLLKQIDKEKKDLKQNLGKIRPSSYNKHQDIKNQLQKFDFESFKKDIFN